MVIVGSIETDHQAMKIPGAFCPPTPPILTSDLVLPSTSPNPRQKAQFQCNFCKKNGEPYDKYTSHQLRNEQTGFTECPTLRSYVCSVCSETGDKAHTLSYCPMTKKFKFIQEIHGFNALANMGDLRQTHFSAAGKRQHWRKRAKKKNTNSDLNLTSTSYHSYPNLNVYNTVPLMQQQYYWQPAPIPSFYPPNYVFSETTDGFFTD